MTAWRDVLPGDVVELADGREWLVLFSDPAGTTIARGSDERTARLDMAAPVVIVTRGLLSRSRDLLYAVGLEPERIG